MPHILPVVFIKNRRTTTTLNFKSNLDNEDFFARKEAFTNKR
jgi:hypothetical protein